jgi:ATP-dependent helicase/DNAse subunit B
MQFRGRNFDHLFVIRTQEATFPQRRVDDPLLPDSDRRQLGIREIGDGRDEERLLFQLLLDGAGTITFSLAGSDTFGKILRPSRMLKGVPSAECRVPSEGPPLGTRHSALGTRQLQLIARSGTRSVFDGYLDGTFAETIRTALQAVSPTQLEDFGECPQKFFFKHILRVEEYDDPDRELQMHHREKGKLDHTILERFYKSASTPDRIDAIVDQAFDEEESRVPAFNRVMRNIERKTTKRNLRAFLADDIADLFANGLRPTHFEYKFGPKHLKRGPVDHLDPFVITAHDVAIRVEGSIDRIDEGKETIRIVDYKSGKALRHVHLSEKIDRGVRLQLALYAMAVAEFFDAKSVTGAIKPLIVRGTDPEKLRFALSDSETRLRETLDLFVASMLRGAFPAFPNDDDKDRNFNACKYCPVNHSCRTRHADAERRVVLQSKDPRTLLEEMA